MKRIIHLIDTKKLRKEITRLLKSTGCEVVAYELHDGFETPCFFIQHSSKLDYYLDYVTENMIFHITYMPGSRTSIENHNMSSLLFNLFCGTIDVEDRSYICEELNCEEEGGVVEFSFVIRHTEEVSFIENEKMANINIEIDETDTTQMEHLQTRFKEV